MSACLGLLGPFGGVGLPPHLVGEALGMVGDQLF